MGTSLEALGIHDIGLDRSKALLAIGESLVANSERSNRVAKWLLELRGKYVTECCYADCELCHADLFAIIEFFELTPVAVAEVGLEEDWPDGSPR